MSILAYPPRNDEEIFKQCTKECGIVTATDDFQYFTLGCKFCGEKFLYFDAFIGHMQTIHLAMDSNDVNKPPPASLNVPKEDNDITAYAAIASIVGVDVDVDVNVDHQIPPTLGLTMASVASGTVAASTSATEGGLSAITPAEINQRLSNAINGTDADDNANSVNAFFGFGNGVNNTDLTDADPALLVPQMVFKQELPDDPCEDNLMITDSDIDLESRPELLLSNDMSFSNDMDFMTENSSEYDYSYLNHGPPDDIDTDSLPQADDNGSTFQNYDEMVEEALLSQDSELTMHIKDRKMIQFLIASYKRNPFLWDHRHPQFRDRVKRQRFLSWIVHEFKARFNISLAKDAITRKWDNLRTVYKRECNRMALERTNISTLWYFRELHFLNNLYSNAEAEISEAVVQETSYRRRFSAIWNYESTTKLLIALKRHQCFYNHAIPDYRSKEKRGEALQSMAVELQNIIDVSTIQISKRISQLRFDYSKQKMERLHCEYHRKKFLPSFTYYEQMIFMDSDVPPFRCKFCPELAQSLRKMDLHMLVHQQDGGANVGYPLCKICNRYFQTNEEFISHQQKMHRGGVAVGVTATVNSTINSSSSSSNVGGVLFPVKEERYNCDLCTATFIEKSTYDEHMRRHNDELFLPTLKMEPNLSTLKPNSTIPDFQIVDSKPCLPAVVSMLGLDTKKQQQQQQKEPKKFACDVCHRLFTSKGHLNAHKAVHVTDRRFKCDYPQCGLSFVARINLLEHVKLHYMDDDYKCDICGKGFKSTKNLQNHKQIHDSVKRYICQICGSAFAQAAGLYLHKRRHNRPAPSSSRHSL